MVRKQWRGLLSKIVLILMWSTRTSKGIQQEEKRSKYDEEILNSLLFASITILYFLNAGFLGPYLYRKIL